MYRMIGTALVLAAVATAQGQQQQDLEKKDVTQTFALGQLDKYFKLVKAEVVISEEMVGKGKAGQYESYLLKLEAIKDVDVSGLTFKVGLFDKNRELLRATPLRFRAAFPLQRGEFVTASFGVIGERQEGSRLVIRQVTAADPDSTSTLPLGGKGGPGGVKKGKKGGGN